MKRGATILLTTALCLSFSAEPKQTKPVAESGFVTVDSLDMAILEALISKNRAEAEFSEKAQTYILEMTSGK